MVVFVCIEWRIRHDSIRIITVLCRSVFLFNTYSLFQIACPIAKNDIQTYQSNESYTETSQSTANLIGQFGFCFSVIGQATWNRLYWKAENNLLCPLSLQDDGCGSWRWEVGSSGGGLQRAVGCPWVGLPGPSPDVSLLPWTAHWVCGKGSRGRADSQGVHAASRWGRLHNEDSWLSNSAVIVQWLTYGRRVQVRLNACACVLELHGMWPYTILNISSVSDNSIK